MFKFVKSSSEKIRKCLDPEYPSNLKLAPFYKAFKYPIATSSCPFQLLWKKKG